MGMRATLIEVDLLVPERLWYAPFRGQRLWCREVRDMASLSEGWLVMPGQGVGEGDPHSAVILPEHVWEVRQGEVLLVLMEVEPTTRQADLALARALERPWARDADEAQAGSTPR